MDGGGKYERKLRMETNGRRWEVLTKVKIGNEWTEVGSTNES